MSSQIRSVARRLSAALALAAVVTLGVSVASPTDAASAASTTTWTHSSESRPADAGAVAASDRRQPTGRLYIAPRYLDPEYPDGSIGAATDVCNFYHLGDQCFKSLTALFDSAVVRQSDCKVHGMDAVIPYIQYSRCRKS
ncbi:hypothetical protein [Clavibacter tessellarius]|uniref:Secreted protein n=1 Tax=Clavibacter tessellarius TaxID=31965 RepID=A0A154V3Z6_9MICO|nr:hypothetical protein [Clavibacter michiganensis]KZC96095.1 hypothetical protein AWH51_04740 [Clavibacter michiganensis subsp. tessellarius]